jgi:trimeric autotransporter adhesin
MRELRATGLHTEALRSTNRRVRRALILAAILLTAGGSAAAPLKGPGELVAMSATTGAVVSGFPRIPSGQVYAVANDGRGGWYVAGSFKTIGGVRCPNLAHVTAGVGQSVDHSWCPRPNGTIRALLRVGSTLYVGGEFLHRIAGKTREGLAAFDTRSGALTPWNPGLSGLDDAAYDLADDAKGTRVYVEGSFEKLGGARRTNLGAVSATTGRATSFAPNPDEDQHGDSVEAFAVGPHAVYAWGAFSKIGGKASDGQVALDPATGRQLAGWHPHLNGLAYAAAVHGSQVLVAGPGLVALDGKTGAKRWSERTGKDFVGALAISGSRVYASVESDHFSSVPHRFVGYDLGTHRAVWHGKVSFVGFVNAIAASGPLVVVGGSSSSGG